MLLLLLVAKSQAKLSPRKTSFTSYFALATTGAPLSVQAPLGPGLVKTGTGTVPPVEGAKPSAVTTPKPVIPPTPVMTGGQKESQESSTVEEASKATSKPSAPRIVFFKLFVM